MIAVFKYLRGCHSEGGISLRIVPGGTTRSKRGKLQKREASQGHERALKMQDRHINCGKNSFHGQPELHFKTTGYRFLLTS